MNMWMIYDKERLAANTGYVEMYRTACKEYGIGVKVVLDSDIQSALSREKPLFVLVRTMCPQINLFFEKQNIPVFNSYHVSSICNDKQKTLRYVKNTVLSVPSIPLCEQELFFVMGQNKESVKQYMLERFSFSSWQKEEKEMIVQAEDFVVKAADGHGGKQVFSLLKEKEQIKKTGTDGRFVLQPMIETGEKSRDLRVYVIGSQIYAAVMRSSSVDFRANFSLGGNVCRYELSQEEEHTVQKVIRLFDFGMAGIDFMFDAGGRMIFNEIEDAAGARMLYSCAPDTDIVGDYIQYITAKIKGKRL